MSEDEHPPGENGVRSIRRAFRALELLVDAAPRTVRAADIAELLDVTPATASRVLATLIDQGYASKTAGRRFTVGPRSIRLTGWSSRLQSSAAGPMARVSQATGENVFVTQLLGGTEVPVAWLGSRDAEQAHALLDMKSPPIWTTASGRALLGCLAPAQRTRVLPPEPYPQLNQGTPTSWAGLRQLIRAGAKDGLFFEYGEVAKDIWCCAVPLEPGDSGEVLALSVACIGEPTGYRRARIHHALSREAHNLYVSLAGAR